MGTKIGSMEFDENYRKGLMARYGFNPEHLRMFLGSIVITSEVDRKEWARWAVKKTQKTEVENLTLLTLLREMEKHNHEHVLFKQGLEKWEDGKLGTVQEGLKRLVLTGETEVSQMIGHNHATETLLVAVITGLVTKK